MSNKYHITTKLGRYDSFYLEADSYQDCQNLITEISEADIISIKKVVFSKKFKINTNSPAFTFPALEDYFYKWSFFVYTATFSKQIDFYHIKKTTPKQEIIDFLLTQMINNEYIIGFYDDIITEAKAETENINNLYQIVYKHNSRTYTENFYTSDYFALENFFNKNLSGDLIEIRKVEFLGIGKKEDNGNYIKRVTFKIKDELKQMVSFIPNIKKTLLTSKIKAILQSHLKFNQKRIDLDNIDLYIKG